MEKEDTNMDNLTLVSIIIFVWYVIGLYAQGQLLAYIHEIFPEGAGKASDYWFYFFFAIGGPIYCYLTKN